MHGHAAFAQIRPAPATGVQAAPRPAQTQSGVNHANGAGASAQAGGGLHENQPASPITAPFRIHLIAQNISGGYQVLAADLNKDGKTDLVALGLSADSLVWYENPSWTPHVITTAAPKMVSMDAADIDGDGIPEIVVAYGFNATPAKSVGNISIFRHSGDPSQPWVLMRDIDKVPSTHRVKFANVNGRGRGTVVAAPILNEKSPGFADPEHLPTPLYAYREEHGWKRELITDQNKGVVHGLLAYDWFGSGRQDILTAGYSGIAVHHPEKKGRWKRTVLSAGSPAAWPNGGAGAVVVGKLAGKQFFASIEPFHGNMVVVYTEDAHRTYRRHVIDDALTTGHALTLVDVDGDGIPEIVAGGNRTKTNLFFFRATDKSGQNWTKMLMDNDMAASNCVDADIKGVGRKTDVVCMEARAPFALKWYEYVGK
jgi:Aldos-2-ulose dehydratase, beta-propeller domain/FG-GAP-like repeat